MSSFDRDPDYEIRENDLFKRYFEKTGAPQEKASEHQIESLVRLWLQHLVQSEPSRDDYKWFYDSGLYETTKNGSVVMEAPIAA